MIWIISAVAILPVFWMIFTYNRLTSLKNEVRNAWHQIDVQLKRRHDLIPNLVNVVKGFMQFEKDTLEKVVSARTKAVSARGMHDKAIAENMLSESLGRLFMVMENYPVLKSSENAMHLQEELTTTENRIAFARQLYNDLVANFRTRLEVFPDNIVASAFGFQPAEYFSADSGELRTPKADISYGSK